MYVRLKTIVYNTLEYAVDELKSIATEVALSNDNDGITVALANFL